MRACILAKVCMSSKIYFQNKKYVKRSTKKHGCKKKKLSCFNWKLKCFVYLFIYLFISIFFQLNVDVLLCRKLFQCSLRKVSVLSFDSSNFTKPFELWCCLSLISLVLFLLHALWPLKQKKEISTLNYKEFRYTKFVPSTYIFRQRNFIWTLVLLRLPCLTRVECTIY